MHKSGWLIPALLLVGGATAQVGGPPQTSVRQMHDRQPLGRGMVGRKDNECQEMHNLQPDGDHDCDDPAGVAEPGTFPLIVLGAGVFWWVNRKRLWPK